MFWMLKPVINPMERSATVLICILLVISAHNQAACGRKLASGSSNAAVPSGPIKTIVVLVMENRSFDHMLGWMKRLNPEIDGVTGKEWNRLDPTDPQSPTVHVNDGAEFVDPDPGHSFQAIRQQIFGSSDTSADPAPMSGFAAQAETISKNFSVTVMSGFRPEVVPVYTALATEFAVCDRWFASVPASTQPNRLYVHSATSHGATSNVASALEAGFPQKTIFDSVYESGLSFGVYFQNLPSLLFYRSLRQVKYATKFKSYDPSFKSDAKAGKLPNYVVIEQRYFDVGGRPANDDHPSHDVTQGQLLVKEVYETLRASPQWNQMLVVVTYDEHGGFYDHVPTPVHAVPSPDGIVGPAPFNFTFNRLGVRVPTLLISPWINKGTVLHEPQGPAPGSQFEHSSVPATVKKLLGLPSPFLTQRDAWAGTFDSVVKQRSAPRTDCPTELPSPPWSLRHSAADDGRGTSEFQQELVQLAGALRGLHVSQLPLSMSVKEANDFVEEAVTLFLAAGQTASDAGVHGDTIVKV